jgi:hypothetical protein
VSATTVDVFLASDVDITRGTDGEYQTDALKINASPITITAATAVDIPNFGLELTGDAGAIAMTVDDTADFYARPINTGSLDATFGASTDLFPEFGAICMSQKRGNEEMFEVELFRCKAIGLPLPLAEKAFAEPEVTAQAFFDSSKNGVFKIRHVNTTPEC